MNILFDIVHISDVNLFKNAINKLSNDKHTIFITLRERGNLSSIARYEFDQFKIDIIGRHQKTLLKKLYALVTREISLHKYLRKNKIQISVNQSFSCIISSKLLKIPFINFEDDYEYKLAFIYAKFLSTRDVMPSFIPAVGTNVYKYNGFKELAYLHPNYYQGNLNFLSNYNLKPFNYVFIREISNISLNYRNVTTFLNEILKHLHENKLKIVLSIENKELLSEISNECIVLEEPVADIYSIISHSLFAISSGDTMAREACLLGCPTIYTGGREMIMNQELINQKIMFKKDTIEDIIDAIKIVSNLKVNEEIRRKAKYLVNERWEDTTKVILKHINEYVTEDV